MTRTELRASIVLEHFESFYHRVYCFCRRSLAPDMAEDIAQDVFAKLLQIERLPEMEISVSYLIKIADNLIKRGYNRNQRFQRFWRPMTASAIPPPQIPRNRGPVSTPTNSATRSPTSWNCSPARNAMPSNW